MTWFLIDPTGYRYPIGTSGLSVGRASDNDVVLDDEEVSRYHAFIQPQEERAWIYDRDSANGVYVNDQRIDEPHPLQAIDTIGVGRTRLRLDHVPTPVPPPGTQPVSSSAGHDSKKKNSAIWQPLLIGAVIGLIALGVVAIFFVNPLAQRMRPAAEPASANIYDEALSSTAFLLSPFDDPASGFAGTGVVMTENGRLLTAYRTVYDPKTDRPYNRRSSVIVGINSQGRYTGDPPDTWYQARVVRADRQRDLAVLQIFAQQDGSPLPNSFRLQPAPLGDSAMRETGAALTAISYQGGFGQQPARADMLLLGEGYLQGYSPDDNLGLARAWIQSNIGLGPQNMGALALDETGKLIGIYTGINRDDGGSQLRHITVAQPLLFGSE